MAAGSPFCLVVLHPPRATIKVFSRFSPQILGRCTFAVSAVHAAQHSQIWINHPVQGLRDLELGLDQDWWLHGLVNPTENDVITTERERQRNLGDMVVY